MHCNGYSLYRASPSHLNFLDVTTPRRPRQEIINVSHGHAFGTLNYLCPSSPRRAKLIYRLSDRPPNKMHYGHMYTLLHAGSTSSHETLDIDANTYKQIICKVSYRSKAYSLRNKGCKTLTGYIRLTFSPYKMLPAHMNTFLHNHLTRSYETLHIVLDTYKHCSDKVSDRTDK